REWQGRSGATITLHLSHRERSPAKGGRVRDYCLTPDPIPPTPTPSPLGGGGPARPTHPLPLWGGGRGGGRRLPRALPPPAPPPPLPNPPQQRGRESGGRAGCNVEPESHEPALMRCSGR